jgi:hypothetical protein
MGVQMLLSQGEIMDCGCRELVELIVERGGGIDEAYAELSPFFTRETVRTALTDVRQLLGRERLPRVCDQMAERVRRELLSGSSATALQVALKCGVSRGYVFRIKRELKQEGEKAHG